MTESSDKEAVLAANEAFYHAFSNQDMSEMSRLWWQGSSSLCIHPGGQVLKCLPQPTSLVLNPTLKPLNFLLELSSA
ncbi:MAG: hypothetical protein ACRDEA_09545 [Microcystaceae cyanobacterium]